jgi:hypothetical protein
MKAEKLYFIQNFKKKGGEKHEKDNNSKSG